MQFHRAINAIFQDEFAIYLRFKELVNTPEGARDCREVGAKQIIAHFGSFAGVDSESEKARPPPVSGPLTYRGGLPSL